jgi:hypothetical protein
MPKTSVLSFIVGVLLAIFILGVAIVFSLSMIQDIKEYKTYKSFCNLNQEYCFCNLELCSFKLSSEDVGIQKELCSIARELNDKQGVFNFCS